MKKKKVKNKSRKKKATFNFITLTKEEVENNRCKAYDYIM